MDGGGPSEGYVPGSAEDWMWLTPGHEFLVVVRVSCSGSRGEMMFYRTINWR